MWVRVVTSTSTVGLTRIPTGARSPGLIEHSTEGDATDTAWYVNSSGDLLNLNHGMMGEGYSIANVRYSYGKFINASI